MPAILYDMRIVHDVRRETGSAGMGLTPVFICPVVPSRYNMPHKRDSWPGADVTWRDREK